jgi:hypothetical protein
MRAFLAIMSLLLLVDPSLAEEDRENGAYFLKVCPKMLTDYINGSSGSVVNEAWEGGTCAGTMRTLVPAMQLVPGFACLPREVTSAQMARVFIKYLKDNPEKLHEYFFPLAFAAFKQAWPCKSR